MLHVAVLNGAVALLVISDDKPLVGHYSAYRCRLTNLVRAVIKRCSALAVGRDNDIVVIQHSLPYIFRHAGIVPLGAAGIRHRLVRLIARPVLIVEAHLLRPLWHRHRNRVQSYRCRHGYKR